MCQYSRKPDRRNDVMPVQYPYGITRYDTERSLSIQWSNPSKGTTASSVDGGVDSGGRLMSRLSIM
jgi:hypothetical protein